MNETIITCAFRAHAPIFVFRSNYIFEIYYKLGNIALAKKYAATLGYNFNDSDWYKKTYKVVVDQNYESDTKKTKIKLRDKIKNIFKLSK